MFATVQADKVICEHRLLHRHRWLGLWQFGCYLTNCRQSVMDIAYQLRKLIRCHGIIGDVCRDDLGREVQDLMMVR